MNPPATEHPGVSSRMQALFLASILVMFAHKVESWWTDEWEASPAFLALGRVAIGLDPDPSQAMGETIFLVFVTWLFVGLLLALLMLRGGRSALLGLALWGVTFVLEWHHLARAALAHAYYPGMITSVVYLAVMALYWRELLRHVRPAPT